MILLVARLLLAVLFAVAGLAKLGRRTETESTLAAFGVAPLRRRPIALALPAVELAVAAALLPAASAPYAGVAAVLLLALFSFEVARVLAAGEQVDCNCFGSLGVDRITRWTLARNVVFLVPALIVAPLVVGVAGAVFERACLRRVHRYGNVAELLVTFGLSYLILELVQVVWGRAPVAFDPPAALAQPAFTLVQSATAGLSFVVGHADAATCAHAVCTTFPATRAFMMFVALLMLLALWLLLKHTRVGLVIQAALTHPEMVEALGHNVPAVFLGVFAGGAALAGLAGVVAGVFYPTGPTMAQELGVIVFVVVVIGGLGSLEGALAASLLIGLFASFAVGLNWSLADAFAGLGIDGARGWGGLFDVKLSTVSGAIPFAAMFLILLLRPAGLLGERP